jgi:hypothetical protein
VFCRVTLEGELEPNARDVAGSPRRASSRAPLRAFVPSWFKSFLIAKKVSTARKISLTAF